MPPRQIPTFTLTALLTALTLIHASTSSAYCRTTVTDFFGGAETPTPEACDDGTPLTWPSGCIPFGTNSEGSPKDDLVFDEVDSLLVEAFEVWSSVDCDGKAPSLALMNRGKLECAEVEYNHIGLPTHTNNNILMFTDASSRPEWPASPTITFEKATGKILDADIQIEAGRLTRRLNGKVATPAERQAALRNVLIREVGAVLGFRTNDDEDSAMYRGADYFGPPLTLSEDDQDGLCNAFPPSDGFQCAAETEGVDFIRGCAVDGELAGNCDNSIVPNPDTSSGWALGTLLALALAVGTRRTLPWSRQPLSRPLD